MSSRTLDSSDVAMFGSGENSPLNAQVQSDLFSGLLPSSVSQQLTTPLLERFEWLAPALDAIWQPVLETFDESEFVGELLSAQFETQFENWLTDSRVTDYADSSAVDRLTGLARRLVEGGDSLLNGGDVSGKIAASQTAFVQDLSYQDLSYQDSSDDTRETARDIGLLSGTQTFYDAVDDTGDYYRFSLDTDSDFSLALTGLSADADVRLTDNDGQIIEGSYRSGSADEQIVQQLSAGVYYLEVFPFSGSTNYSLNLSATAIYSDGAGNSLATAREIGTLNGSESFQDFVGASDTNDYYRFTLNDESLFNLTMDGLSTDADVELLDSNGALIQGSFNSGAGAESIEQTLSAGSYYVRVHPFWGDNTDYNLTVSASVTADPDGAGNRLETARDIGLLSSSESFQDFVGTSDTNDYYRFTLNDESRFNLTMDSLSADADVELLDSNGLLIQGSYRSSAEDESIEQTLSAGSYYVRVYPFLTPYSTNDTDYRLLLSASAIASSDGAGNTLETARDIGLLSGSQYFQDAVDPDDTNDYYRFELRDRQNFSLTLNGLAADADVELLNSRGQVITNSTAPSSSSETISEVLDSGVYYVNVYPFGTASTDYQLVLSTSAAEAGFSSIYGYGLVDAAAAVASAIGQASPLPSVADSGGNLWGADLVNAPEAWAQGYTGNNVVVAVVDTGVDVEHTDLRNNIWTNADEIANNGIDDDGNGFIDDTQGWDFFDNDERAQDRDSHGTHVAGTIAAANNGFGVTGIAYGSEIMPVRVLGPSGSGSNADVAAGIRYAADNGADVINLSLGGDLPSSVVESAIQYATERGSFVVMASGNKGDRQSGYPARFATEYGVAVGAVDRSREVADFSNSAGSNSSLQYVVAPGVGVRSTVPGDRYDSFNGTSMATPHVAGVVALMLSANADLTHAQIRQILTDSTASVG